MIREVDLVSYLPPFLTEYKQITATLDAENPEFIIAWNAADRILKNEFIDTSDEYGISRFERILKIYPSKEDTLESRRARLKTRWVSLLPYTEKMFLERLISICGENDFTFTKKYEQYKIEIEVSLELFGQVEELVKIISEMFPCNIVAVVKNNITVEGEGPVLIAGGVSAIETVLITNDFNEEVCVDGMNVARSGIVMEEYVEISNEK